MPVEAGGWSAPSGIATALVQKPLSASLISIQPGLLSLCCPASSHDQPSSTRTDEQPHVREARVAEQKPGNRKSPLSGW
ncbi:MAG: hypothetical protein ABI835_11545 [Chloroflexota bacterium]